MAASLINLEVAEYVAVNCIEVRYRLTESKLICQANVLCTPKDEPELTNALQVEATPLKSFELFSGSFYESITTVHVFDEFLSLNR
jgi:hypothetical protein